jgi:hypothetical protein
MKKTLLTLLTLLSIDAWGNINYIQIKQIPNYQDYSNQFDFLFNTVQYYNHWVPEWSYDVSKKSLIQDLKDSYNLFSFIDSNNLEINLLLGDISHYLYNLQEDDFYNIAINHYEKEGIGWQIALVLVQLEFPPSSEASEHSYLTSQLSCGKKGLTLSSIKLSGGAKNHR